MKPVAYGVGDGYRQRRGGAGNGGARVTLALALALAVPLGALPGMAWAQAAAAWLPEEAAVREAVRQAPDVQAAEAAREAMLARAGGIRAGNAETVLRTTAQGRRVRDPSDRFAEGQLLLERPLRLWGKSGADADLADVTEQAGRLAAMDARHEASRQVLALWFAALRAQQARAAAQAADVLAAELARVTERRLRAGDAARLDHELSLAERARTTAALAAARAAEASAQAELRARFPELGVPAALVATPALPDMPAEPAAQLRNQYLLGSHEFLLAQAQELQAQRQARRIDLERHPDPTVGVFVTIERGGAERIAGVSVSMPLGSAARRSNAAAAAADAEGAARRRLAVERKVGAEFEQLYHALQGKRSAAEAQAQALALQRSAAARSGRAYAEGEAGLTELLVVRRNLADSEQAERLARVDALEADTRLQLDLHRLWDFDD
nr:TolC family protein [Cupriavidus sp. USMAA2-4]